MTKKEEPLMRNLYNLGLLIFVTNPTQRHGHIRPMLIKEALVVIFAVWDSKLGESLLDSEKAVLEYSGNSLESEDEVERAEESQGSDESDSDESEDAAANTGGRNGRGCVLHFCRLWMCN